MIFNIIEREDEIFFVDTRAHDAADLSTLLWDAGWNGKNRNWRLACFGEYENAIAFEKDTK